MYDPHQHDHIGYYEDGHDVEVVAFKRKSEDVWDVFVEEYNPGPLYRVIMKKGIGIHKKGYGLLLFSIYSRDPSYEQAVRIFKNWLNDNELL